MTTPEEANYYAIKGTMERKEIDPSKFNDTELKVFFGALDSTIKKLKNDSEIKDNKELWDTARLEYSKAYEEIIEAMKYFIDMPEEYYKVISLWIIGTYLQQKLPAYPFLFLNASKGSAKTRTENFIASIAYGANGMVQTGVNETTLFRMPKGATLVIDECNSIGTKDKANFRDYLCACYKRGSYVLRSKKVKTKEGEDYQLEPFEPYRPVCMANIWGMEETLADRCITLILEKSLNSRVTKKMEDFSFLQPIKVRLIQFGVVWCSLVQFVYGKGHVSKWNDFIERKTTPTTHTTLDTLTTQTTPQEDNKEDLILNELFRKIDESEIDGRNLELMFPLLIIANLISPALFDEILPILKDIVQKKKEDQLIEDKDAAFLDFVANRCGEYQIKYIHINELTRQFREFLGNVEEGETWLNAYWVGRALKRSNLVTLKRRLRNGIEVLLNVPKAKQRLQLFQNKGQDK